MYTGTLYVLIYISGTYIKKCMYLWIGPITIVVYFAQKQLPSYRNNNLFAEVRKF